MEERVVSEIDSPEHFRLFVAIYPSAEMLKELERAVLVLKRRHPARSLRWLPPSQWHITLVFLGDVAPGNLEALSVSVKNSLIGICPFHMAVCGLGVFPSSRLPRVLWAGISRGGKQATLLSGKVTVATRKFSTKTSDRPFHPHLTLAYVKARTRRDVAPVRDLIAATESLDFGHWRTDRVVLVKSILNSEGAQHTVLEEFILREPTE